MNEELPIFTHWYAVSAAMLDRAGRFPRNLRPTLGNRLIERCLDLLDAVIALRYTRDRQALFASANLQLEKLRILVRLCFEKRLVSTSAYEQLAEDINTCGRMLGGWRKATKGQT